MYRSIPIFLSPDLEKSTQEQVGNTVQFFTETCGIHFDFLQGTWSEQFLAVAARPSLVAGHISACDPWVSQLDLASRLARKITATFNIDPQTFPFAAWSWHEALSLVGSDAPTRKGARRAFRDVLADWRLKYKRAFVFGTGPSLKDAGTMDFSSGFRILCNSAVRDYEFVAKLQPHVIAAADALYYFSDTPHAQAFQKDLEHCLRVSNAYFVYPQQYDTFVRARLREFGDRLIPVPIRRGPWKPGYLGSRWRLPARSNVLNVLLLPLAMEVSTEVVLLGFDGRKEGDSGFWSYSRDHNYPDERRLLFESHPAMFNYAIPSHDPNRYSRNVFSGQVGQDLANYTRHGFQFALLNETNSTDLQGLPLLRSPEDAL